MCKRLFVVLLLGSLYSGNSIAQSTATLTYDAKGRLIKFTEGATSVDYVYDSAGNRTVTGNNLQPSQTGPLINYFSLPPLVRGYGQNAVASWSSTNSTSCRISFENNSEAPYESLPSSGSLSLFITTTGMVFLTCINGQLQAQEGAFVIHEPEIFH